MSRPLPISDAAADFLLAGGAVDDPGLRGLAQVLRSASAPGRAEELAREDAVAAAFVAARLADPVVFGGNASARRRRPIATSSLVSAVGFRAAVAALASAAVAVIAFAATIGVLPNPLFPRPASDVPGASLTTPPGSDPTTAPSGSATPGGPTPGATASPGATPLSSADPYLVGLCQAYLASTKKNKHPKKDLVAAAGGADNVTDFCIALVGSSPSPQPSPTTSPKKTKPSKSPKSK